MRCMFCGHGHDWAIPYRISEEINSQVDRLIALGVREFWSGGMGAFDLICERAIRQKKEGDPSLKLFLVIPYLTSVANPNSKYLLKEYDEIIYPGLENVHFKAAIIKRNRWMVDNCEFMLAYVQRSDGGARRTLSYAEKRKNINIINLAEYFPKKFTEPG